MTLVLKSGVNDCGYYFLKIGLIFKVRMKKLRVIGYIWLIKITLLPENYEFTFSGPRTDPSAGAS